MLSSFERRELPMFSLTNELVRLATDSARALFANEGHRSLVQQSPDSPPFILSRDETELIVLQKIVVEGVVFYLGVAKP